MKELLDYLPQELVDNLDKIEYQEDGGLMINTIKLVDEDLIVIFKLSFGGYNLPIQTWQIDIKKIKTEKIIFDWANYPEIYSDHSLLRDYLDNYTELYFNSKTENSEKLFIDLFKTHNLHFGKWIDFGTCINAPDGILELCKSDSGLFARGSKRILEKYEDCLIRHGIKTKFIGEVESEDKDFKLLIFGKSYFIAKDFEFRRIE